MKKYIRWAVIAIAIPIVLFLILVVLLYCPPVQNWAVKRVASYASQKMGMNITVDRVKLVFPLDLGIEGVRVLQPNDSISGQTDTIANVGKIVANVQLLPLLSNQVEVNELSLHNVRMNTANIVHEARIKGNVGLLLVQSRGVDLNSKTIRVNQAQLKDANLSVELSDTVPPDTTKTPVFWKIKVDKLLVERSKALLRTAGDTMAVLVDLPKLDAKNGYFDLYKNLYRIETLNWQNGSLNYDLTYKPRADGLDPNHIRLTELNLGIDSFYFCQPELKMNLRVCAFKEKSGVRVNHLSGHVALDSTRIVLPNLELRTPESSLTANFNMDMNAFDDVNPGKFYVSLHASLGKVDLLRAMGGMPEGFRKAFPNYPLRIDGVAKGNKERIAFSGLNVVLPTAFKLQTTGYVEKPMDARKRKGEIFLKANTYNLNFAKVLLDKKLQKQVNIPSGIALNARAKMQGEVYQADATMREGGGSVQLKGRFDARKMAYEANVKLKSLALQHFLPNQGLHPFTGEVEARGAGTDFMSPKTQLFAKVRIDRFHFGGYDFDKIAGKAQMHNGVITASLQSNNPLLKGSINVNGRNSGKLIKAHINTDLAKLDLYNLHLLDQKVVASFRSDLNLETNGKDYYKLEGNVADIMVNDTAKDYRLGAMNVNLFTNRDTTHANLVCGDFALRVSSKGGYAYILNRGMGFWTELRNQLATKHINEMRLRERLPLANVYLQCGKENIFMRVLRKYGYSVGEVSADLNSSPVNGLNGYFNINQLMADSILIDTVRLGLKSDAERIAYSVQVRNNKKNPQYVFNALLNGALEERGTYIKANIYDEANKLGIGVGVRATMEDKGIQLSLMDREAVLGYKRFTVNDGNYVFLGDDRRVRADVRLRATDGTGILLTTNNDNEEALQDITLSLNHFNLEKLFSVLPYMPEVSGTLNGDFHAIQTKESLSISSAVSVTDLVYQQSPMGNLSSEFVYMPKSDGGHYIDGTLSQNDIQVGHLSGTYNSGHGGKLDATLLLERLPLAIVNGFIPQRLFGLNGYAEGEFVIKGPVSKPLINGEVYLDSAHVFSDPYGVTLRFANDPVRIVNSHLLFENFEVFAHNDSPLNISGEFDFSNPDRMRMDMRMRATKYEIINSKENYRSEVFGKVFVNFNGRMSGELSNLSMRGKLDVLDATDMTYVLRDSPLSTDNQMEELVSFTNFAENKAETINRPALTGFNMDLSMSIDPNAHILCALNADKSNYIDLMGGGNLRMRYTPVNGLRLTGRYTLNNGEMKYSLPVIPLKTFTIKDGSYIEFTGDPMNPRLNITATEITKASVTTNGSDGRIVEFECGVVVTKTLKNMGLEFTIDAPQDMTVSNQLNTMGSDERGKLAVTMLTTGMYLADGNTSSFSMNNALSAFLQSQINNITGNALRTLDLSFGLDNVTDASGNMHTDYSFKFAKRLWSNRLRIIVGGKVSSGSDAGRRDNSFFDNVSLEYRLNQGSTRYMQLFYNRDSYDWLEGDIGKYGFGFIWRRKLRHFRDIFRLKVPEEVVLPATPDSLSKEKKNGE